MKVVQKKLIKMKKIKLVLFVVVKNLIIIRGNVNTYVQNIQKKMKN